MLGHEVIGDTEAYLRLSILLAKFEFLFDYCLEGLMDQRILDHAVESIHGPLQLPLGELKRLAGVPGVLQDFDYLIEFVDISRVATFLDIEPLVFWKDPIRGTVDGQPVKVTIDKTGQQLP